MDVVFACMCAPSDTGWRMATLLKHGSKGEPVQSLFGYTVDGIVGEGTEKLIAAQIGFGFNSSQPDAVKRGLEAQNKKGKDGTSLAGAELVRTLKRGVEGADVRYLQRRLAALGFTLALDGIFGQASEDAVRKLQKAHSYDVDGVVGHATHHLINQQIGLGWHVG
jgi:hypothetical protein